MPFIFQKNKQIKQNGNKMKTENLGKLKWNKESKLAKVSNENLRYTPTQSRISVIIIHFK